MPEVRVEEAERFMVDSLVAGGAPLSEAKAHADLLLHADIVGHFSHGMNRLGKYILLASSCIAHKQHSSVKTPFPEYYQSE